MKPSENELYYPNPNGTIQLGTVMYPPDSVTWCLCVIKIDDKHYGLYTGESLLKAQIQYMAEEEGNCMKEEGDHRIE